MTTPKKTSRNPKLQDEKKRPEQKQRDFNPDRREIGRRTVDEVTPRTAADLREFADTLSAFQRDELAQIPIVPAGMRLEQGAVYFDLDNPKSGPITASGEWTAGAENRYVPKAEIPYEYWNRLLAIFSLTDNAISEERIDETLADSFPTSDPPSWNMGKEARPVEVTETSDPSQRHHQTRSR